MEKLLDDMWDKELLKEVRDFNQALASMGLGKISIVKYQELARKILANSSGGSSKDISNQLLRMFEGESKNLYYSELIGDLEKDS